MKVSQSADYKVAVGVVEGKIYVIGGSDEDSQVEVFDSETQTWDFEEKAKFESDFCVYEAKAAAHVPQEQLCLPSQALSQELLSIVVMFRVELMPLVVLITQFNQHVSWWRRKLDLSGGIHSLSPVSSSPALQHKSED
ncbi:hypothetical protein F2Q68_00021642 [Brassica cretica]|uniref:Uncharacterized protein n=1 Tax=Brassica cretica TaxID=69181 RepID=A0A8S9FR81_BRACR|nr:hypothetical protein F2Q68_00021642 [Brassica cretica]